MCSGFQQTHGLKIKTEYVVTKAHTGIYPPVDNVYYAMRKMGIKVTGTDRYRKYEDHGNVRSSGFMHEGIAVSN